jgi:hypothetical protein
VSGAEITEICSTIATIVTLLIGFLSQRKQGNTIHQAVNSTSASLLTSQARVEQLTSTLTGANIEVPKTPEGEKEI